MECQGYSLSFHIGNGEFSDTFYVNKDMDFGQIFIIPNRGREYSISQSQQGKERSVIRAWSEIPRLLLLCDERQMPTHGAFKVTSVWHLTEI